MNACRKNTMKTLNLSVILITLVFLAAAARPAQATVVNALLGRPIIGNNGGFSDFGSAGATPPYGMTDGNTSTGWYVNWTTNASVNYDLGSTYDVDTFAVFSSTAGGSRNHPSTVVLDFYSDITFATLVTTRTVSLANLNYSQAVFPVVMSAEFVRITTPAGSEYMTNPDTTFGLITELELYTFDAPPVPEPSTFALLCVGMVGLAAKGRRHRRVIA